MLRFAHLQALETSRSPLKETPSDLRLHYNARPRVHIQYSQTCSPPSPVDLPETSQGDSRIPKTTLERAPASALGTAHGMLSRGVRAVHRRQREECSKARGESHSQIHTLLDLQPGPCPSACVPFFSLSGPCLDTVC